MKATNKICQIAAIVLAAAALVLFFFPFVSLTAGGEAMELMGSQLAAGDKLESGAQLYKSAHIAFCGILTIIATALAGATFAKSKKFKYAAPAVALIGAVYMLVIRLSSVGRFVDTRPLTGVSELAYTPVVLIVTILLFAAAAFGIAHLLVDDAITVAGDKEKLTIPKRLVRFLRDYKSELKKIVWPGKSEVIKNTIVVLVICLIIGAFIWLLDFGLGSLVKFISSSL